MPIYWSRLARERVCVQVSSGAIYNQRFPGPVTIARARDLREKLCSLNVNSIMRGRPAWRRVNIRCMGDFGKMVLFYFLFFFF